MDDRLAQAIIASAPDGILLVDAVGTIWLANRAMQAMCGRSEFARTLSQVTALRPDRVALYGYAHLPERFKAQRRIADHALPPSPARVAMLGMAMAAFAQAGYVYIGMDHFALPGDALAKAKHQGRLHRNFQDYSTHSPRAT